MINIGLAKGVVKSKSLKLIEELVGEKTDKNKLSFCNEDFSTFLLKHRDIPQLIEKGIIDIGITSEEWIEENGSCVDIIEKLDWCDTRVSLISPVESSVLAGDHPIHCVTEFPKIAEKFFKTINRSDVKIEFISGSSEALVPRLYDCCIDCVETGSTLKLHNLYEEYVIFKSKIVLVTNIKIKNKNQDMIERIKDIIK